MQHCHTSIKFLHLTLSLLHFEIKSHPHDYKGQQKAVSNASCDAAFDKGDLLYLRDEEDKRRFAEQELRESELRSFARMRQKTEALNDDADLGIDAQAGKDKGGRCLKSRFVDSKIDDIETQMNESWLKPAPLLRIEFALFSIPE